MTSKNAKINLSASEAAEARMNSVGWVQIQMVRGNSLIHSSWSEGM